MAFPVAVDGEGDVGFDVTLPCSLDTERTGQAPAPVYSVTDLHKALTGAMDSAPDIDGIDDQDDDPESHADLEAQYADAVA